MFTMKWLFLRCINKTKCLRKYKPTVLIVIIIILLFQIFLTIKFITLIKTNADDDGWQPQYEWIHHENSTQKKQLISTNVTALRLDELAFKPACEIGGRESISAIHRAKTQACKQLIANITCQAQSGLLYPKRLAGSCPSGTRLYGKSLGCYKDESNYRLLSGYFGVNKKSNSPEYCMDLCLQSGFPYAGVQYGNECFCGNDEPPSKYKLADTSCNMRCPGNPHATCGGYYTMNIYETGIIKFVPQIANLESMDETKSNEVKIVFLLTLNGRALRQVKRLLKIIYHRKHYYYIHVDVREDYLFRELLALEKHYPNIRLARHRFATIWGGASLLTMLLSCMTDLLATADWKWDFVLNLSESDYPVKHVSALEQFLSANLNRNFVKSHGRDTQRFLQKQGLDKTFVECEMRMWRVGDRQLPHGIQIDGGSDWIALSRPFVKYVTARPNPLIDGLLQVFGHTLLPAESFFHTVLRNSEYCNTYVDNNLHVTNWKRKLGCKCQYKHVVDWCGCSPNDFRPDDWARIEATASRRLFFARKFEPIIDQAVILKLELWLYGLDKPSRQLENLNSYWQNIYHHLDMSPTVNDGLMTVLVAATRRWTNGTCATPRRPLTATTFKSNDTYRYTLVYFEVKTKKDVQAIEIAFKPRDKFHQKRVHLSEFHVSNDYDPKEQLSRNFARILATDSEPVLSYHFKSAINDNLTVYWMNPRKKLMEVTHIWVDDKNVIGHSKPTLKRPLHPGRWTVVLRQKDQILAETNFAVFPIKFYAGIEILSQKQYELLNGFHAEMSDSMWRTIDGLFEEFYVVDKVCAVDGVQTTVCGARLMDCRNTWWSSFAPDPKSVLDNFNTTTGSFTVW